MRYEAKTIPEGINTSKENPLKEFFLLVGGAALIITCIIMLALYASDYLVKYIPIEAEQRWFSSENFSNTFSSESEMIDQERIDVENYLQDLTDKLQDEQHKRFSFKVRLVDDDIPNAFITPGGNIFITLGLLKTVSSENALAMVLGHEMGHQYHRHPIRSAGRGIIFVLAFLALSGFEGNEIAQSFIGNTASIANLAFSRDQEREADHTGAQLIIKQYGHALDASQFFQQMNKMEEQHSNIPVFLRSHPGTEERIELLNTYEDKASGEISPLPAFVTQYLSQ